MLTVPRLCQVYPGIRLTTEEKARKKKKNRMSNYGSDKRRAGTVRDVALHPSTCKLIAGPEVAGLMTGVTTSCR